MRLLADENMPLVTEFFSDFGEVRLLPGRQITAADVAAADVLLVRSVTKVNASLIQNARLRFVGTATIGTDHLDLAALAACKVAVASAPGCNARAVGEYVATTLALLGAEQGWQPSQRTLGVVGLGNTGRQVAALARILGFRIVGCDPFVTPEGETVLPLEALLAEADILSLHVPLTCEGPHATRHLINAERLRRLRPGSLLINSSRGEVVDNAALRAALAEPARALTAVLDVWEGEPYVSPTVLERVRYGSPHVAGYSQEGKWRGTEMIYQALCQHLGQPVTRHLAVLQPDITQPGIVQPDIASPDSSQSGMTLPGAIRPDVIQPGAMPAPLVVAPDLPLPALVASVLAQACNLPRDDVALRASMMAKDPALAFDELRKNYPVRREFAAYRLRLSPLHPAWPLLQRLGFRSV